MHRPSICCMPQSSDSNIIVLKLTIFHLIDRELRHPEQNVTQLKMVELGFTSQLSYYSLLPPKSKRQN